MRLKHVLRRLVRTPLFSLIAAVTLAVGIGGNSAIFSVIHGILLKPLPYDRPEELVDLNHTAPGVNFPNTSPAPFLYFTYREQNRSFESIGLYRFDTRTVTGIAEPEEAACLNVTAEVLPMLGLKPAAGRWFSAADDAPGAAPTMMLGYGWWQARFGGERSVIGRPVVVNGVARQVIGVMPANFRMVDRDVAFLLPMQLDRGKAFLGEFNTPGIGRLKPGVTMAQASADLARLIPVAFHSFPPQPGLTTKDFEDTLLAPKLQSLRQKLIGDIGKTLWVVMGTLGILLLIACANVANLLLVRAEGRQHELAIRSALGAGWGDIARELLMESLTLGLAGGVLGLGLAYGAVRLLVSMAPGQLPRLHEIAVDGPVMLFTLGVALFAGLLFGAIPALKYAAPKIAEALRGGGRGTSTSRERHRARNVLVVAQVALALVLLVGAGLVVRTFAALRRAAPGFDPKNALTLRLTIPVSQVRDPLALVQMQKAILDHVAALSGVEAAGMTSMVPMTQPGGSDQVYARDKVYTKVPPLRRIRFVSPGLPAAMGNRLAAGREFTWTDTLDRRPVALVSENLARELWGDARRAIGKEIRENLTGPWREVVGVVKDVREDGLQAKAPATAYYPLLMSDYDNTVVAVRRTVYYVVRSRRAATLSLLEDVQRAVRSVNGSVPLAEVRTLEEIYDKSMARTSFTLAMLGIAGGMALLIGVIGIYGVISYSVSQRRREIGIRMALGAERREMARMFVAQGVALAGIGIVCGLAGAAAVTGVLRSLLFEVSPVDPATYAAVSAGLIGASAMASWVPAVRASRVDVVEALRE